VDRGLSGVRLIISDACRGLVESIADYLPEARWQRGMVGLLKKVAVPFTPMRSNGAVRGHRISDDFRMRWARVAP